MRNAALVAAAFSFATPVLAGPQGIRNARIESRRLATLGQGEDRVLPQPPVLVLPHETLQRLVAPLAPSWPTRVASHATLSAGRTSSIQANGSPPASSGQSSEKARKRPTRPASTRSRMRIRPLDSSGSAPCSWFVPVKPSGSS